MLRIKGLRFWLLSMLAALVLLAIAVKATKNSNVDNLKEQDDSYAQRYLSYPGNFARFLSQNPRQHSAFKRARSALDSMSGVVIGKRSGPVEFMNFEPIYGRQFGMHPIPRMYDLRWAPIDSYDSGEN